MNPKRVCLRVGGRGRILLGLGGRSVACGAVATSVE